MIFRLFIINLTLLSFYSHSNQDIDKMIIDGRLGEASNKLEGIIKESASIDNVFKYALVQEKLGNIDKSVRLFNILASRGHKPSLQRIKYYKEISIKNKTKKNKIITESSKKTDSPKYTRLEIYIKDANNHLIDKLNAFNTSKTKQAKVFIKANDWGSLSKKSVLLGQKIHDSVLDINSKYAAYNNISDYPAYFLLTGKEKKRITYEEFTSIINY